MAQHTPGPWSHGELSGDILDPRGRSICEILDANGEPHGGVPIKQAEANARLIAAAPELLNALKEMLRSMVGRHDESVPAVERARAAIAKATGED